MTLLRKALGSAATPMPLINIGSAFSDAANAAVGMTLSPAFSPCEPLPLLQLGTWWPAWAASRLTCALAQPGADCLRGTQT